MVGLVKVLVNLRKWSATLSFYVFEYGTHPNIGYSGLQKLKLSVDCALDSLVGEDGVNVLCNMVQMGDNIWPKDKYMDKKRKTHFGHK